MTEYRDLLERQLDLLAPPRIPIDRLTRRRARQRRNQRIAAGVVAAAISVLAISGLIRAFSPTPKTGSPSPRPAAPATDLSYVDVATGQATLLPASIREVPGILGLQVSPSGSMLAFGAADPSGIRQVYVADVGGSNIRRISHDTWQAFNPSWSPDGTQILFEGLAHSGAVGIYIADASGEGRRVLTLSADDARQPYSPTPRFSPDGTHILYTRKSDRSIGLWTTSIDGGSSRRVLGGAAFGSYSPDGRSIVYRDANLSPGLQTGISFFGDVTPPDGAQTGSLPMGAFSGVDRVDSPSAMPDWSPDGERVVYADPFADFDDSHPLYIFEIASGERTRVGQGADATWFDDDTLIVRNFEPAKAQSEAPPSPTPALVTPMDMSFVDVATGEARLLPTSIRSMLGVQSVRVSPDHSLLAFEGMGSSGPYHHIYVANLDGTRIRRLSPNEGWFDATSPAWSSDGRKIVFEANIRGTTDLFVVDVSEGRTTRVTRDLVSVSSLDLDPSFSADGRTILYTLGDGASVGLWTVPVDGGPSSLLVPDAAFGAFSPDGNSLAYRHAAVISSLGIGGISFADADGSHPRKGPGSRGVCDCYLLQIGDGSGSVSWSPDGSKVAYLDPPYVNSPDRRVRVLDLATNEITVVGPGAAVSWFDDDTLIVQGYRSA